MSKKAKSSPAEHRVDYEDGKCEQKKVTKGDYITFAHLADFVPPIPIDPRTPPKHTITDSENILEFQGRSRTFSVSKRFRIREKKGVYTLHISPDHVAANIITGMTVTLTVGDVKDDD